MKTAITILNLSDLHIDKEKMDRLLALELLPKYLSNYTSDIETINWQPDYIVIPGDIVDSRAEDKGESYNEAYRLICSISEKFNWNTDERLARIIITPGNHDKENTPDNDELDCPNSLQHHRDNFKNLKTNFELYCGKDVTKDITSQFVKSHEENFTLFSAFNKRFTPASNLEYEYCCDTSLGEILKYCSGIKIFHKHKICFLCLNTEWLYTRKKVHDELVDFCNPIVIYLCKILEKSKYRDYTVVTLMHHKPDSLTWEILNNTNEQTYNVMEYVEHLSSIIISGHDHPKETNEPDMLKNSIQHFRLGSPSCAPRKNERFPYSVSLIHIDPINLRVSQLNGKYDDIKKWTFEEVGDYKLRDKFGIHSMIDNTVTEPNEQLIRLKAKSSEFNDIEQSIRSYYKLNSGRFNMIIKSVKDINNFDHSVLNTKTHLIIYSLNDSLFNINKAKKAVQKMKDTVLKKKTLLMEVVVSFVVIHTPKNNLFDK